MSKVLNKRVDIQVLRPQMAMLELQKAIQDGFVIDITNRGGVVRRGSHVIVELVKSDIDEQAVVVDEQAVVEKPQTKPRTKTTTKVNDGVVENKDV